MDYAKDGAIFWMGGRLATELIEVSHDPSCLNDGQFWAVSTTFEGAFTAAKFATVVHADFPNASWNPISAPWTSTPDQSGYINYVDRIRELIAQGWVYQVNACRQICAVDSNPNLRGLFSRILENNPAPWASYLEIPGINIASASPELFLKRSGSRVKTSPIKGTQSLGSGDFGVKDKSENIMIVDLMRNDLGIICKSGSVEVTQLLYSQDHPGLQHLVSDVEGDLIDGISWSDILRAVSPPGSVSGAPKSSALSTISDNEKPRGPYCGALGWVHGDEAELSVAIRIFWKADKLFFGTGAGITFSSDSQKEWEETELKASRLVKIAAGLYK
ncbi:MAG: chorismate-binding protein [Actinomycetales bacterium]|nr:chorismate-binding protein [Actinomycetales bacterium]